MIFEARRINERSISKMVGYFCFEGVSSRNSEISFLISQKNFFDEQSDYGIWQ